MRRGAISGIMIPFEVKAYPTMRLTLIKSALLFVFLTLSSCATQPKPLANSALPSADRTSSELKTYKCTHPFIEYVGRFAKTDDACRFSYPGSEIQFKFHGKKLEVSFEQINQLELHAYADLRIDDADPILLSLKTGEWQTVFESDKPETHRVSISKRNEVWMGEAAFKGLNIDGRLTPLKKKAKKQLLFIGSSGEVGFGNLVSLPLGEVDPEAFTLEGTNHYFAYPAMVTRHFNAEHTCVCFGGRGLTRGYDGNTGKQLPVLTYQSLALASEPADMHESIPDLILLHLGGNDFVLSTPDEELFISTYLTYLRELRKVYPTTPIVISYIHLEASEQSIQNEAKPKHQEFLHDMHVNNLLRLKYQDQIKLDIERQEIDNVYYWRYTKSDIERWGEAMHPSLETQESIAGSLIDFIAKQNLLP